MLAIVSCHVRVVVLSVAPLAEHFLRVVSDYARETETIRNQD